MNSSIMFTIAWIVSSTAMASATLDAISQTGVPYDVLNDERGHRNGITSYFLFTASW